MTRVTDTQLTLLRAVVSHVDATGTPPPATSLATVTTNGTVHSVMNALRALRRAGAVDWDGKGLGIRTLQVLPAGRRMVTP